MFEWLYRWRSPKTLSPLGQRGTKGIQGGKFGSERFFSLELCSFLTHTKVLPGYCSPLPLPWHPVIFLSTGPNKKPLAHLWYSSFPIAHQAGSSAHSPVLGSAIIQSFGKMETTLLYGPGVLWQAGMEPWKNHYEVWLGLRPHKTGLAAVKAMLTSWAESLAESWGSPAGEVLEANSLSHLDAKTSQWALWQGQ